MAVQSTKITVTTTPTPLTTETTDSVAGYSVTFLVPAGGQTVYVGGSGVTAAQGFPITAGTAMAFEMDTPEVAYAVVATGTQAVNCLWRGV